MLKTVRVAGAPRERGRQLGADASAEVHRSVEVYREAFAYFTGLDWHDVCRKANEYREAIKRFDARYLAEIEGIAEGAGLDVSDVLALNARTEVLAVAPAGTGGPPPSECTSVGIFARGGRGPTIIAQNWDWLELTKETIVVLEIERDDAPNMVTVVEAGLLAKCGMNAAGVGLATNALTADTDPGRRGVPFHVLLRAILDSGSAAEALGRVLSCERASSANYLIGQAGGSGIDAETSAGDYRNVYLESPQDGLLLHTNHFRSSKFMGGDLSLKESPDSPFRLARMQRLLGNAQDGQLRHELERALADHVLFPFSICAHPDPAAPPVERWATLAGVMMDLDGRRMWLADGNPCESPFVEHDLGQVFGGIAA